MIKKRLMTNNKFYYLTICGLGPAGLGTVIQSVKSGYLDNSLKLGIMIIDSANELGGGSLTRYHINSNTLAKVLLETFDTPNSKSLFFDQMKSKSINRILNNQNKYIPCSEMGFFLNELGDITSSIFSRYKNSNVEKESQVISIKLRSDGKQEVIYKKNNEKKSIISENIILTLGAEQSFDIIKKIHITKNDQLKKYESKIVLSSNIIEKDNNTRQKILNKLNPKNPKIVVLGGSHSAWSVTWFLMNKLNLWLGQNIELLPQSITIVHRSKIKLFYNSAKDAYEDNYIFEKTDICPLSGRVNRFRGLRGDAFDLAKKHLKSSHDNIIRLISTDACDNNQINDLLSSADIIIPAFGYRAKTVPIYDESGKIIPLKFDENGLVIDERTRIIKQDGQPLNNILAYGLGAGMKSSSKVGGESALSGRIDGIWLFQNDVGKVALNTIIANLKKLKIKI